MVRDLLSCGEKFTVYEERFTVNGEIKHLLLYFLCCKNNVIKII